MGIRGLEKFMKDGHRNFQKISILHEIKEWQK